MSKLNATSKHLKMHIPTLSLGVKDINIVVYQGKMQYEHILLSNNTFFFSNNRLLFNVIITAINNINKHITRLIF